MRLPILICIISIISVCYFALAEDVFTCDSSKKIPYSTVNDDYCDCKDGTDETKTAACPNGKFLCQNKKFKPKYISTSLLNDHVCDCCDGSDEQPSTCEDVCAIDAEESKKQLREEYSAIKDGLQKKKKAIEEAAVGLDEAEEELEEIEKELEQKQGHLTTIKDQKEEAEKQESDVRKHRIQIETAFQEKKTRS